MRVSAPRESSRRLVHLFFGLPALAFPWLDWRVALIVSIWALILNAELLPRTTLGAGLFRPGERFGGIVLYPLTVVLLCCAFRADTLPIAAGWCLMAFGDPAASIVGGRWPGRSLPWNPAKSVGGSLAFFVVGALVATFVMQRHGIAGAALWPAPAAAAFCAVVESLPSRIDDNLRVGLAGGLAAWGMT